MDGHADTERIHAPMHTGKASSIKQKHQLLKLRGSSVCTNEEFMYVVGKFLSPNLPF